MADDIDDASVAYEPLVDLRAATFPWDPHEVYRVQLHAPHDRYVFKLWLESTRSKEQWTTRVTNLQAHAPDAVMLPLSIVLSCLERSLVEKAHVDVSPRGDGSLSLKLTIEVEFAAPILYVFNLTAVGVDLVHVLEAKMRDCDAAIESLSSSSKSKDVVIAKLFDMLEAVKTDVAQLRGVVGRNHELAAVMPNGAAPPKDVLACKAAPVVFDVDDMPLARDRDDAQRYPKRAKKDKPSKTPTDSANGDK